MANFAPPPRLTDLREIWRRPLKNLMADGYHFENRYIAIFPHRLSDFDVVWHAGAEPVS